jgi:hypothetical protein
MPASLKQYARKNDFYVLNVLSKYIFIFNLLILSCDIGDTHHFNYSGWFFFGNMFYNVHCSILQTNSARRNSRKNKK